MKLLKYKRIVFDDWTEDKYGVWAQMCQDCLEKYKNRMDLEIDSTGGCGACSVQGCSNVGLDNNIEMTYIDFDINGIEILNSETEYVIKSSEGFWNNDGGWVNLVSEANVYLGKDIIECDFKLPIGKNVRWLERDKFLMIETNELWEEYVQSNIDCYIQWLYEEQEKVEQELLDAQNGTIDVYDLPSELFKDYQSWLISEPYRKYRGDYRKKYHDNIKII